MNKYYPVIARAVERLDGSTGETRRTVYERARKAVALLRANQPALLDADIANEYLALEEAILKVEAEAACCLGSETGAKARSKFNPATTGNPFHWTDMIGRSLCLVGKHQYSSLRPMNATA
jgi:hypothetical protein